MLWLAAYLTGFPPVGLHALSWTHGLAPMWSGLYIISTDEFEEQMEKIKCVSMPSRAYTSFLHAIGLDSNSGILTVSMPSRAYTSFLQLSCEEDTGISVPVSMPSRAYTSFLLRDAWKSKSKYEYVSMPSRAYTSFLRYPFKNLGFMRFPEPVFAGICQNILTTAVFRAC